MGGDEGLVWVSVGEVVVAGELGGIGRTVVVAELVHGLQAGRGRLVVGWCLEELLAVNEALKPGRMTVVAALGERGDDQGRMVYCLSASRPRRWQVHYTHLADRLVGDH